MALDRPDPRRECERRLADLDRQVARARSLDSRLSWARLVAFVLTVALAGRAVFDSRLSWGFCLAAAVVFGVAVVVHGRVVAIRRHAERGVRHHRGVIDRLEDRWAGQGQSGSEFADPDHPYSSDLDLFGRGSLFERVSTARTPAGAATLARWLTTPAEPREILRRQEAVADLRARLELREDLAVAGEDVVDEVDARGFADWTEAPASSHGRGLAGIATTLAILNVLSFAAWAAGGGGIALAASLAASVAFALALRARTRRALSGVERRLDELRLLAPLLARLERERFSAPRLVELRTVLDAEGEAPSVHIARLARIAQTAESRRNLFVAPIAAFLLLGTQLALAVERWHVTCGPFVRRWIETVGEIEALASLAGYAWERPDDPFPEIAADGPCFVAEGLAHPLLSSTGAVRNDVRLEGQLRLLVVSGSNMSGKSTLLRTVGVNAVLAAAGSPISARRLRLSPLAVGASMRIVDSLQDGTSHFYAEIRRLARLVELGRGPRPLLFLLDELLHGTNSRDRRAGAEAVLRGLVADGGIGLVTTHDLALAAIADALAPRAANVNFEDRLEGDRVVFDYRLRPGTVEHSNAIALMRAVGLDVG